MSESLSFGDVEYRKEEIHSVSQKDYIRTMKIKNLKKVDVKDNTILIENNNKSKRKLTSVNSNQNYLNEKSFYNLIIFLMLAYIL